MSTLVVLVVLLLGLVGLMAVGLLAYCVHRHPTLTQPLSVALAGSAVLITLVATIISTAGH
ncbi:hypothetical protein [Streptomyces cylindrosporus]|uniref:Uncharacterized protein n=1 Tax=Streptomyces cylindrosporus TaxID=2927583 RepID=A0ABS9YBH1_9ACTN|nr:hypothetical protein [Streptomyces cylindrosporus]MCI3274565.1 hypothetical protein [Streptomyces cylindrosporus]